ncbi:MAG: 50S ribosomal protein L4 [Planctomycetes bacterium]|nr:50S ribosomal protein L4 [Planctomycetota bacterium]
MTTVHVFDLSGKKLREVEIDPTSVDKAVRRPLLKEALIAYNASQRQGTHKTKTRSEVAGGGAKPWRQKGTGRARAGTTRAAHWVGGGRAHGPRPRDYHYQLPKKQRLLARRSSIRYRLEQSQLYAVEGLGGLEKPNTKTIDALLSGMGLKGRGVLFVSEGNNKNLHLSARNIQKADVSDRSDLCAGAILRRPHLIFSADAFDKLVEELSS